MDGGQDLAAELRRALDRSEIYCVYQPIVNLDSRETVAFEALARGPQDSPLETPAALFATAQEVGLTDELDWACRTAALRGAVDAGLSHPLSLFVNVEPRLLGSPLPGEFAALTKVAGRRFRRVLEVTERAVTSDPAGLLTGIREARERGVGVALDDIGAVPESMSMLPFLRPDVIKLDLRLVQRRPGEEIAQVVHAVNAQAERTQATVLAEGIETEEHLETAVAFGATLGQGWMFGRPSTLDLVGADAIPPSAGVRLASAFTVLGADRTPFEILQASKPVRRGRQKTLLAISRQLEKEALALNEPPVVVASFQEERFFTDRTKALYSELAKRASFVAALGVGMAPEPVPGVRGANLPSDDPLRGEWVVLVVGSHFSAAFAGRDLGDPGPNVDRRFDLALTYDRDVVLQVAQSLLGRVEKL
ncbi:MAG: EAL domain-containing protein [Actinomycetota bacterium]|nr:EAL domain-containing protein [Actinomycetota bacterium]